MKAKSSHIENQISKDVCFNTLLNRVSADRDREAFKTLFDHFAPRIKSFLMKSGLEISIAEELMQDTMMTIWEKAALYDRSQAAASTWIFTIARNKKIDYMRKAFRPDPDFNDPVIRGSDPEQPNERIEEEQHSELIKEALKELPKEQADLVKMSFFGDKTHKQIAEETDIPLGTVKSRIRLALNRMNYLLNNSIDQKSL